MDLKNKLVAITGPTSGLGRYLSINFAKEFSNIALIGRDNVKLISLKNEISVFGVKCEKYFIDLNSIKSINDITKKIYHDFDQTIDIFINNAASAILGQFEKYPEEEIIKVFNLNLISPFSIF